MNLLISFHGATPPRARRAPHHRWLGSSLFLLLLSIAPPLAAGERVTLKVRYGFRTSSGQRVAKLKHWTPVAVEITFAPSDPAEILQGEVRLHAWSASPMLSTGRQPFIYTRPFSMGAGRKALGLYCVPSDQPPPPGSVGLQLQVSLYDRGLNAERKRVAVGNKDEPQPVHISSDGLLILTLGEDRMALPRTLLRLKDIWKQAGWMLNAAEGGTERLPLDMIDVMPSRLNPEEAPDIWIGYQGVDALIWDTPRPEALRPAQLRAIQQWVLQGGRLILHLPATGPLPGLTALEAMLPARVEGRSRVALVTGKPGIGGAVPWLLPPALREACAGMWEYRAWAHLQHPARVKLEGDQHSFAIAKLVPTRGRVLLPLHAQGDPLLVRGSYGLGTVTMLAPDLGSWPLLGHAGQQALLGRALGLPLDPRDVAAFAARAQVDIGERANINRARWQSIMRTRLQAVSGGGITAQAETYLSNAPPLKPVPFWWVVAFFSVYVALVGPLDYLILRRSNRLRLTWITFLFYVVAFAGIAYGAAYAIKGGKTFARLLAVRDEIVGSGLRRDRTFFGLFSARSEAFDLDFGPGAWPVAIGEKTFSHAASSRSRVDADYPTDGLAERIDEGDRGRMLGVPLRKWSMKSFAHDGLSPQPPAVTGTLYCKGKSLQGRLTVGKDVRLRHAVLITRHHVYTLGDMEPGSTWQASPPRPSDQSMLTYFAELKPDWDRWRYGRNAYNDDVDDDGKTDTAREVRRVVALSFCRLLGSWNDSLRVHIRDAQIEPPRLPARREGGLLTVRELMRYWQRPREPRTDDTPPAPATPATEAEREPNAVVMPPALGLSIEQIWNAEVRPDERYLSDLSELLWQGGVVLVASLEGTPSDVQAKGWALEREGITILRAVFPFDPRADGGKIWGDDLFRSTHEAPREIRW